MSLSHIPYDREAQTTAEGASAPTAVVTGCTEGIGAEVTTLLLERGYCVVGVARSPKTSSFSSDPDFLFVPGDVGDHATASKAVESAIDWSGRVDVLVNNAARDFTGDLLAASEAEINDVFRTNVVGAIYMLQESARAMQERGGGSIVNVSSRLAVSGVPTMVIYGAAKGAILSLTRGAAVELAPFGIRVNAVAPGLTETPLFTAWLDRQDDPQAWRTASEAAIPQGRFASPRDVASAILFLLSEDASHITGASLAVDGGYTAK